MTSEGLSSAASGAKYVGAAVYIGAKSASNTVSSKLDETGVTDKVKDGYGFVK